MRIGVLALQGDVSEHYNAIKSALDFFNLEGEVLLLRRGDEVEECTHIVIPGGESTTISRLIQRSGIFDEILKQASHGSIAVMGTCAGSILMAKNVVDDDRVKTLGLIDMDIRRNAFGRQRESFEADIDVAGLGKYHAVFIRAPIIERCGENCQILARIKQGVVMVKQSRFLALVFHPELTTDFRIYQMFFEL